MLVGVRLLLLGSSTELGSLSQNLYFVANQHCGIVVGSDNLSSAQQQIVVGNSVV
jgi:hypothetical protein